MKMRIRRFYHEWSFSISLSPGVVCIELFYFSFAVMTTKFFKENKLNAL